MTKKGLFFYLLAWAAFFLSGCYNDALDPTQIGRFEPTPTVNVILDTLGVADEPSPTYEGAEDPKPEDLVLYEQDYVFGPGDVVRISIFELYQEGVSYVNDYSITETGRISIPDVGVVRAAGLTETELEREIAGILSPSFIKDPSVTVLLLSSESQIFSIVGQGVAQSSRFRIPRNTSFRLTDAIAVAGGIGDFNVTYIYISRDVRVEDTSATDSSETFNLKTIEPSREAGEEDMLEMITPSVSRNRQGIIITSAEMATRSELEALAAPEGIDPLLADASEPDDIDALLPQQTAKRIEWQFIEGKWVAVEIDSEIAETTPLKPPKKPFDQAGPLTGPDEQISSDFGLDDIAPGRTVTRVIQVPADRLLAGDPRYNIIIRPGDRITVPRDLVGEFWVAGNINGPGAYAITGRPITLKQAIATAGGLNAIAWPSKVEVVRRLGKNNAGLMQEEIVLVDLKKIAEGTQPDFFIKPNDYINVGTHGTSRWLAVLRNAFRATYGFGLIYDRNFATDDFGNSPIVFPF